MWLWFIAPAWLGGIWLGARLPIGGQVVAGAGVLLVLLVLLWDAPRSVRAGLVVLLCVLAGSLRVAVAQPHPTPASIWLVAAEPARPTLLLEGYIAQEPRRTAGGQQVVLASRAARLDQGDAPVAAVHGLVLLQLPAYPTYHYGQHLLVRGRLETPYSARVPGQFDYRAYLARRQIYALMREPEVRLLSGFTGNRLRRWLLDLRQACQQIVLHALPEPQAGVAAGMLLGIKTAVPAATYDAYRQSGAAHVLVISGWHLSLVAGLLLLLTHRLRRTSGLRLLLLLAGIWLYALFVGGSASVLRAAIMASLVVVAGTVGRNSSPWRLLLVPCILLTLADPWLLWDVGLQLSVLATAGVLASGVALAYGEQPELLEQPLAVGWLALKVTLMAQIFTAPLLAYHFGNLSLVAPLTNLLLLPAVALSMGVGMVALLLSGAAVLLSGVPVLGWLVAGGASMGWLVGWLLLAYQTWVTATMAALPWATVQLPDVSAGAVLGLYLLLAIWYAVYLRVLVRATPILPPPTVSATASDR